MIGKFVRLIVGGVLLASSILLYIKGFTGFGVLTTILSGISVLFHFKNEKNLMAFALIRKNKLQAAGNLLRKVKHPEKMVKSQEAYHYYLLGLVEAQEYKKAKAEKLFKKALNTGLRTGTDQAVARLNLAGFAMASRNKKLAKYHIQECKKLDKRKMLTEQIREVETMMKRI
ncbi:DUF2892 domain-containing protein [Prolixibacteraceae bacterium JC049]|nr:DUF2892 domain-containing protein [Prolixibacteraceae bacterium JC049]